MKKCFTVLVGRLELHTVTIEDKCLDGVDEFVGVLKRLRQRASGEGPHSRTMTVIIGLSFPFEDRGVG